MIVRSVRHRGLLRLIRDDDSREVRSDLVQRVRRILTALISASDIKALQGPPGWGVHQLQGDRAGIWSISVSGNWRLTFEIRQAKSATSIWRTTTDERCTCEDRHDSDPSGRVHPRGNSRPARFERQ